MRITTMLVKQHKYLFSKTGKPLKLSRRVKEKRLFPTMYRDTSDYIKKYFAMNSLVFVGSDYGY